MDLDRRRSENVLHVKAEDFFVAMLQTAVEEGEILTLIKAPITTGEKTAYLKVAQSASGFAVCGIAARLQIGSGNSCDAAYVAVTGVADKAYRAKAVEAELVGKRLTDDVIAAAASHAADDVDPLSDIHASSDYRAHLARVYARRAVAAALES